MDHPITTVSVIICTHNPRPDYLSRALEALKGQTLPQKDWELLIVDNGSDCPVSSLVDLSWHPKASIVAENEIGLTRARLQGIKESRGDLIVFVDDDNVLFDDYLSTAVEIARSDPKIGVFGAGIIRAEFETPPNDEIRPHLHRLAIREESRDFWGNVLHFGSHLPFGAGLCATRDCAQLYVEDVSRVERAKELDRRGGVLTSAGDLHLGLTACRHGYLAGVTPRLQLIHLIPPSRCKADYVTRVAEGTMYSLQLVQTLILGIPPMSENPVMHRVRVRRRKSQLSGLDRSVFLAEQRGLQRALSELKRVC